MMQRVGIAGLLIALLALCVCFFAPGRSHNDLSGVVIIGDQSVSVALADTPVERAQGLSSVSSLKSNEGMLFIFPEEGIYSFWMKDMLFPIDILWLSTSGEVIHIEHSISPETYPTAFVSKAPARFVLELPAGFSNTYGIKIGDRATLPENSSEQSHK